MEALETWKLYRLAYNASRRELRGALVYFLQYVERPSFDIRRAQVRIVGTSETYLVSPSLIIPF